MLREGDGYRVIGTKPQAASKAEANGDRMYYALVMFWLGGSIALGKGLCPHLGVEWAYYQAIIITGTLGLF